MHELNMETVKSLVVAAWADGAWLDDDAQREMVEALISVCEATDNDAVQIRAYAADDVQMRRLENILPGASDVDRRLLFQHEILTRYGLGGREALDEARNTPFAVLKRAAREAENDGAKGLYAALFERV